MVLHRKLDYRLNGYHFPSFPSVPISAKGKRSVRRRSVENRMHAFNILAAVADKLLETENSSATFDVPGSSKSDSKQEILNEKKPCKDEFVIQNGHPNVSPQCDGFISRKDSSSWKEPSNALRLSETSFVCLCSGSDGNSLGCCRLDDPVISDFKTPLMRSESNPEIHISKENGPYNCSFPHSWDALELPVHRDDDENSSRCTHPCTSTNKSSKPYLGANKLKKLLTSRYWKVDLGVAKPADLSKTADVGLKPALGKQKISYTFQRTQRISFKKRKLFKRCLVSASRNGFNRAGFLNLLTKKEISEGSCSAALHEVNGIPSTTTEQLLPYKPEDCQVKFSIKSFIVPELFVEIPETATVGSLKRTVMEAITAIIGSGLHVGVLLQGKHFGDDDRTLIQAGISHANELDELSFTLESNSTLPSTRYSNSKNPHFLLPCESTELLARLPNGTSVDQGKSNSSSYPALLSTIICHESDRDFVHPPLYMSSQDKTSSCEALPAVPLHNPRRSDPKHRRIRRPFTVSEVEALVQAVENLGTGRWRDVKLRSFDDAKHRTYVDLKDKWKTLVHTARISPQQRRGEPVPQELLNRVLNAHAHWSQQQAKLQAKPPSTEACLGVW
ncbi:Telomere-binding protein 1 [Platanthera guangdongensis]|uniref:Telomere-binding protein 1 n=1 Tax=Platanthera guangdongensis TaxID=2320717 RepID=A0ABR2LUK0_9ASPA